jgi:hypothetical protein
MSDVKRIRLRFTIRQSLLLIAICAVAFALLRTPFLPLVIGFGLVLPGFLIERARGGSGILGGACSGGLIALGVAIGTAAVSLALRPGLGAAFLEIFGGLFLVSMVAFCVGVVLSSGLYVICGLLEAIFERPLSDESRGPIFWDRLDEQPAKQI